MPQNTALMIAGYLGKEASPAASAGASRCRRSGRNPPPTEAGPVMPLLGGSWVVISGVISI